MSITINKCAKCGHEWPQSGKKPPRRCPASGCRTVKWQPTGFYEAAVKSTSAASKRAVSRIADDLLKRYSK